VTAAPTMVAAAPANAVAPPARAVDADELALLMKRAKEMLSAGDIPAARLLLRRAADAQEPTAALMLAQTYDPAILGTQDARNIIPDPETARVWYQKAAQLGSTDAQRRLAQMQN
jgi:TPR repeat protein